jgi:hypothetical protein
MTENAKDIVTARGRPSGIAITITVTAVRTALTMSERVAVTGDQGLGKGAKVLS